jgi:hypothetical protein
MIHLLQLCDPFRDAVVAALPVGAPEVADFKDYAERYLAGKGDHVRPLGEFETMLTEEGYQSTMLYRCLNRNLMALRRVDDILSKL